MPTAIRRATDRGLVGCRIRPDCSRSLVRLRPTPMMPRTRTRLCDKCAQVSPTNVARANLLPPEPRSFFGWIAARNSWIPTHSVVDRRALASEFSTGVGHNPTDNRLYLPAIDCVRSTTNHVEVATDRVRPDRSQLSAGLRSTPMMPRTRMTGADPSRTSRSTQ